MKHTHKHYLARLLVWAFLIVGIGFWMTRFVVDAASRTIGALTRDNQQSFLSWSFWTAGPNDNDIIAALYGSGNDTTTVYTTWWHGYDSWSCLAAGMNVWYISNSTWFTNSQLHDNFIYVVEPGTYNITWTLRFGQCTALVSSGIVILSGNVWTAAIMSWGNQQYIILDKIRFNNNHGGIGLSINGWANYTLHDMQFYYSYNGLYLSGVGHMNIYNSQFSGNIFGINARYSNYLMLSNIQSLHNGTGWGITFYTVTDSILTWVTAYNNLGNGLYLRDSANNTLTNIIWYDNVNHWLSIIYGTGNTFDSVETFDNGMRGIFVNWSINNIFTNIISTHNENWFSLYHASWNVLSGITLIGNYYWWIDLYLSNNNTGTAITSNSSSWCLYLDQSTYNNFIGVTTTNSPDNGVVLLNNSNYNTLSGLVSSGNMWYGVYYANSNNNTISHAYVWNNTSGWIIIETGNSNTIAHSIISSNMHNGMFMKNSSWNIVDASSISWNGRQWIWIVLWNNDHIINSTINNNHYFGIATDLTYSNVISWVSLSWNTNGGIYLFGSVGGLVMNTHDFNNGGASLAVLWWTGNVFTLFSWNREISINIYSWRANTNVDYPIDFFFDSYTKANNYIDYHTAPYITLTGSIALWEVYYPDFNKLEARNDSWDGSNFIISWVNYFTIAGDTRDGRFYSPTEITTWTHKANLWETWITLVSDIYTTIQVISWSSSYLTMNWWTGTFLMYIWSWSVWQYLTIFKSNDWLTWTKNTTWCSIDAQHYCSFITTWDIKLFAFWVPQMSFSGMTSNNIPIISGWYYNTWVSITFTGDYISGATLSGVVYTWWTIITGNGRYVFVLRDIFGYSTWAIFTIDTTNPIVTGNYPTSWLNISWWNNIIFLRSGSDTNMSGYTLYVSGTSYTTSNTSYTINNMSNGNYTWYVVATDRAGNTWASPSMPFSITTPLSWFVVITWTNTKYGLSHPTRPYTKDYISLSLQPNQPCNYQITWDIVTGVIDTTTGAIIVNVYLSWVDGAKYIYVTLSNNSWDIVSKTILTALDTTKPSDATLHTPTSGAITSWAIWLSRYAASDTGVGLSWYQWIIASDELFTDILRSWFTSSTTATVPAGVLGNMWTFYWKVRSLDRLWLTGQSTYRNFYYSGSDYTPDDFTFDTVTNARLNKIYLSSKETIEWLSTGTHALVEISRWSLYINGDDVGWQTGLVENGDTVQIELISSDEYETRVSSTITIGEFSTYFRVTTKADTTNIDDTDIWDIDTNLSTTEKLQIVSVFMALKDMYSDSTTRTTFFTTLMNSLQDQIDSLDEQDDVDKIDALQYLYDVVDNYLWWTTNTDDTFVGNSDRYVAPNGKVYQVTYNTTAKTYTSPNFIFKKTFTTLAAMKAYIDVNNGGGVWVSGWTFSAAAGRSHTVDTTWQSAPYQAPNGKTYRLFRTTDGRYSSYDFSSAKYFISVDALKSHIYQWNK